MMFKVFKHKNPIIVRLENDLPLLDEFLATLATNKAGYRSFPNYEQKSEDVYIKNRKDLDQFDDWLNRKEL